MDEEERAIGGESLQKISFLFIEEGVYEGNNVEMGQLLVDLNFVEKRILSFSLSRSIFLGCYFQREDLVRLFVQYLDNLGIAPFRRIF